MNAGFIHSRLWKYWIKWLNTTSQTLNSSIWVTQSWCVKSLDSYHFILLSSGFKSTPLSLSFPISCTASWIFACLAHEVTLVSSIIYFHIIIYPMIVIKIYIVAPYYWASSLFKYLQILSNVVFLNSCQ